jgi:hypothetical protein
MPHLSTRNLTSCRLFQLNVAEVILMADVRNDYIDFIVQYAGKTERCRVTKAALLNREPTSKKDTGHGKLIEIFVKHRAEIESLALAKLGRGHSDSGVVITNEDLKP